MPSQWEQGFAYGWAEAMKAMRGDAFYHPEHSSSTPSRQRVASMPRKRAGKKDPKMARALRKANALGRKKSGGFKKGYSQARIMKKAHQLRRKM